MTAARLRARELPTQRVPLRRRERLIERPVPAVERVDDVVDPLGDPVRRLPEPAARMVEVALNRHALKGDARSARTR